MAPRGEIYRGTLVQLAATVRLGAGPTRYPTREKVAMATGTTESPTKTGSETDIEKLQAEIQQLRAETTRDLARHGFTEAREKARGSAETAWTELTRQAQGVSHEIEDRPLISALIAFGFGLVLGLLLSGRR